MFYYSDVWGPDLEYVAHLQKEKYFWNDFKRMYNPFRLINITPKNASFLIWWYIELYFICFDHLFFNLCKKYLMSSWLLIRIIKAIVWFFASFHLRLWILKNKSALTFSYDKNDISHYSFYAGLIIEQFSLVSKINIVVWRSWYWEFYSTAFYFLLTIWHCLFMKIIFIISIIMDHLVSM